MESAATACVLDMMLLVEYVADDTMATLLPINSMRNYGLLQARTRLVAMIDVDLLPSQSLYQWLKAPGK
jgi:glycosyltransferase-like protein LARGE